MLTTFRRCRPSRSEESILRRDTARAQGPLHPALRELEHAGPVVSVLYRGTHVAGQKPNSLRDACALRSVMEVPATTQIPPADRHGIVAVPWELVWQMGCKLNEGRYSDLADNDLEFLAPICDAYWNQ